METQTAKHRKEKEQCILESRLKKADIIDYLIWLRNYFVVTNKISYYSLKIKQSYSFKGFNGAKSQSKMKN